ncbi:hypothetical protein H0H92_012877 [Tricholoma furcatifolium]|nr:hypothetical protein H0H92_012877 [Tricholoma furcatifolium]
MDSVLTWLSNDGVLQRLVLAALKPYLLCRKAANNDFTPSSLDSLGDEEINFLWESSAPVDNETYRRNRTGGNVRRITDDTVAKVSESDVPKAPCRYEMDNGNFVRAHTDILIPRYHRLVRPASQMTRTILLSQYISGRTLGQCWDTLGPWMQFRVALTLRHYIRQLRSLSSSVPGPVGEQPQLCYGPHFIEGGAGPFPDYEALSAYYAARLETTRRWAESTDKPIPDLAPFDNSLPLVMTHQDLNERNIILGNDNQLWIIDWQLSGFYPEWFEYSSVMRLHGQHTPDTGRPNLSRFVNLIAGKYEKPGQQPFYRTIYRVLLLGIL